MRSSLPINTVTKQNSQQAIARRDEWRNTCAKSFRGRCHRASRLEKHHLTELVFDRDFRGRFLKIQNTVAVKSRFDTARVPRLAQTRRNVRTAPHASVGCGIPWQVTCVHSNRRAEFHVVRHRRGSIMAARGYMAAGSRIYVDHSSGSTDDRSEAPGSMIDILTQNSELARRRRPTRFTGRDGRNQSDLSLFYQVGSLLRETNDYPCSRTRRHA